MADASLRVELVSADRVVWSGDAQMVIARTTEGELGILVGHAPLLAVLVEAPIEIRTVDGEHWVAVANGGFMSVANNRISIISEHVEAVHDIDLEKARHDLERAQASGEEDSEAQEAVRFAEARIRAVERAS